MRLARVLALEPLVEPWDKKEIRNARLDRARTGEEVLGEAVAKGAESKLVARVAVPEELDHVERGAALGI